MSTKIMTREQQLKIRSIYLENFNKKTEPPLEQRWLETITTFIRYEGGDVVPEEIRLLEGSVIDKGLADDYIQTLHSIIKPSDDLEESEKLVLLLSCSPEERLKALRYVLAV